MSSGKNFLDDAMDSFLGDYVADMRYKSRRVKQLKKK